MPGESVSLFCPMDAARIKKVSERHQQLNQQECSDAWCRRAAQLSKPVVFALRLAWRRVAARPVEYSSRPVRRQKKKCGTDHEPGKDADGEHPGVGQMEYHGSGQCPAACTLPNQQRHDEDIESDAAVAVEVNDPLFGEPAANWNRAVQQREVRSLREPSAHRLTAKPIHVELGEATGSSKSTCWMNKVYKEDGTLAATHQVVVGWMDMRLRKIVKLPELVTDKNLLAHSAKLQN